MRGIPNADFSRGGVKVGTETVATNTYGQAVLSNINPTNHIILNVSNNENYYCIPAIINNGYRILTLDNESGGTSLEIVSSHTSTYTYTYIDR